MYRGHPPSGIPSGLDGVFRGRAVLKRGIDIVVAGIMLVACLPLLVMCAVLIKLDSHGPILFRQARIGRDAKVFNLLKLRTMRAGEDGPAITLGIDPRITLVGGWLRRWKLDELPQLWNVLRGEMSLVGPRPVIPELAREFAPDYRHLLRVRPGLTDPATIQYCREAEMLSRVTDPLSYFKTVRYPRKTAHLPRLPGPGYGPQRFRDHGRRPLMALLSASAATRSRTWA